MNITQLQAVVFLLLMQIFFLSIVLSGKTIYNALKKVPWWLFALNSALFFYKVFLIPHVNGSRGDYGKWILWMAKSSDVFSALEGYRSPIYFFMIKIFSGLWHGIGFEFVVNLNLTLCYFATFLIYLSCLAIFKNRLISGVAASLYALSPIIFIFSANEDYTNPAIFFSILSLFFISLFVDRNDFFLLPAAIAASFFAIGSRPDYIIFSLIFCLFFYFYAGWRKRNKIIFVILYFILLLPRLVVVGDIFFKTARYDTHIHSLFVGSDIGIIGILTGHWQIFFNNLENNILALLEWKTLLFSLIAFSLCSAWYYHKNIFKKEIIFFSFFSLILFFWYSFLHNEGIYDSYKYLSFLVLPLSVTASVGIEMLCGRRKIFVLGIIILLAIYTLVTTSPFRCFGVFYKGFDRNTNLDINYEYVCYLNNKQKLKKNNAIYIANSSLSYFYSMPIDENKIYPVYNNDDLLSVIKNNQDAGLIYVSQGTWGFGDLRDDFVVPIPGDDFEKMILNNFILDEKLFSFYTISGHHVFLYKMLLKT